MKKRSRPITASIFDLLPMRDEVTMVDKIYAFWMRLFTVGFSHTARTAVLTALALVAFAANSIFCRLALGSAHADPASFTAMRLLSGALMRALLRGVRGCHRPLRGGSWRASLGLFLYASAFSFAYVRLTAGTGALILFATVQVTMLSTAAHVGGRLGYSVILGIVIALAGIGYLLAPGLSAPPPMSALLMVVAGLSWGIYSLLGRSEVDPLAATTGNFVRAAALSLVAVPILRTRHRDLDHWTGLGCGVRRPGISTGIHRLVWCAGRLKRNPCGGGAVIGAGTCRSRRRGVVG
jgi:drug/metabolite transporter (DMT)-like permease